MVMILMGVKECRAWLDTVYNKTVDQDLQFYTFIWRFLSSDNVIINLSIANPQA